MEEQEQKQEAFKIFDLYDVSQIAVKDMALKPYINISPKILLKSHGRNLGKGKVNIVEKLAHRLGVPGHYGKKHKVITSWTSGHYNKHMSIVLKALKIIEDRTKKNPVQVLVEAIEKSAPRDEVTVIEHAGAKYPQSVDVSPSRRVDLATRWIVLGAYSKSFGKKNKMAETLAREIILASEGNMDSFSANKRNEAEKQADSAR